MAQHMQSVQQIPVEVQRLAEVHSLGAPTASYSQRSFMPWLFLIMVLLVSPFFLGLFTLGEFGSEPAELVLLIATACFGGLTIYVYLILRKLQVHMHTEGFVYLRWRKAEILRWDQIETIWYKLAYSEAFFWDTLHLRKTDGTELKVWGVNGLRDAREIYRTIEREFSRIRSPEVLPGMIEQYEAGHAIAFGDLSVNKLGLTYQGVTLPWSQVQSIDVGDQLVEIKKEGQGRWYWFKDRVPNQSLLRELMTYVCRPH